MKFVLIVLYACSFAINLGKPYTNIGTRIATNIIFLVKLSLQVHNLYSGRLKNILFSCLLRKRVGHCTHTGNASIRLICLCWVVWIANNCFSKEQTITRERQQYHQLSIKKNRFLARKRQISEIQMILKYMNQISVNDIHRKIMTIIPKSRQIRISTAEHRLVQNQRIRPQKLRLIMEKVSCTY